MRCDEKKNERDNENENKGKFSEKVQDIIGAARVQNWNGKCFFSFPFHSLDISIAQHKIWSQSSAEWVYMMVILSHIGEWELSEGQQFYYLNWSKIMM